MRFNAAYHVRRVLTLALLIHVIVLLALLLSCAQIASLHNSRFFPTRSSSELRRAPVKQLLILDGWERMVNVQYMLRRLVHIAVDADFALVEPFMYESKISLWRSLPSMFERRKLSAQTAATYFRTDDLYHSKRYISFQQFAHRVRLQAQPHTLFIHAVLFLNWHAASSNSSSFYWCDEKFSELPGHFNYSSNMHQLAANVQVAHALCVAPSAITNRTFFHTLFRLARTRAAAHTLVCKQCVSVAVANYRKHAVQSYRTSFGDKPSAQPVPPLLLSTHIQSLCSKYIHNTFGNSPFVALHLRTGKMYTELRTHNNSNAFERWLSHCVTRLLHAAHLRQMPLFVASDLFNDGWLGGERASAHTRTLLSRARQQLLASGAHRFDGSLLAQDAMGVSSAVDAAICSHATHFIWARPSSLGRWVQELRASRALPSASVACDATSHGLQ